jgi:gamma-glutamylcysteine synthetase
MHVDIDWDNYKALVKKYSLNNYRDRLVEIMEAAGREFEELGIRNPRRVKQIKGMILAEFSS